MSRWKVKYDPCPSWETIQDWAVYAGGWMPVRRFHTWREAQDYADQLARTMKITLPRVTYGDHVVAGKGVYSLHVYYSKYMTDIYLGGWDGAQIPNSQLWDLAVYLAACATHWEAHQ